ncbi:MAG TPA: hypothetical protein VG649_01670 [Candidatus Angelobacter sp.]|jgi:hypothetical protein|nr:hypothetical protein [Candidatus Angelobacter sp.]
MSTNLSAVLQELLQNTSNLTVLRRLMTPDATYVSLSFDNPELKKVTPWAGTHKGPQALSNVFAAIQRFWKTLDFSKTAMALRVRSKQEAQHGFTAIPREKRLRPKAE